MLSQTSVNESRSFIVKLLERDMTTEEVQREELQYPEEEQQQPQKQEQYLVLTVPFGQSVKVQFVPRSMHRVIASHWNRVMHMLNVVLNSTLELYTMERAECARLYMKEDKKEIPKEVIKAANLLFMSGMEVWEDNTEHQEHESLSSSPPFTNQRRCRRRYAQYNPEEVMRSVRWLIDLNFAETLFAAYSHAIRHHVEMFLHLLCCVQAYLQEGFAICCKTNSTISHNMYVLFVLTTFWKQFRSALSEIATVSVFLNRWYICHYAGKKSLEEVGVNCLTELLTSSPRSVLATRKKYNRYNGNVTRANNSNANSKLAYSTQYHIDLDGDKTNSKTNATVMEKEDDDYKLHKQEFCTLLPLAYSGFGELIEYELSSDAHAQELQQILNTETTMKNSKTTNVQVFVNELLSTSTFGNWQEKEEDNIINLTNTNNKCNSDIDDMNKISNTNIGGEDEESDDNIFFTPRSQRSVNSAIPSITPSTTLSVTAAEALLSQPESKFDNVKTREISTVTNIVERQLQEEEQNEQELQNMNNIEVNDNNEHQRHSAKAKHAKKAMYSLFQEFVSLCTAMDVYNETFMPSLQCTIEQYYTNITNTCEQHFHEQLVSASVYFSYVHDTLDAWRKRTFAYLHHNSWPILEEQLQKLLLDDRARAILKRDFAQCMQCMNYKTLSLAERLLSESTYICDRQCVLNLFKNYVEEVGKHIMQRITEKGTVKSIKHGSDALITANATLQTKNMTMHNILLKILCNGTSSAHSQYSLEESSSVANTIIAQWNIEFATVLSMLELLQTMNDMIDRAFVHAKRDYSVKLNEALEIVLQVHSQQFALQLACFANAIMIYITRSHEEETKENQSYRITEPSPAIEPKHTLEQECKLHNVHNKLKTSTTQCNSISSPSIHEETHANQSNSRKRPRLSLECDEEDNNDKREVQEDNENEEYVASSNDSIISNTSKTNMEAVHNDLLKQISVLFAHTPDKLYFISVYEYQLAQRLLSLLYNVDSKRPSEWTEQYEEEEQKEQEEMVEWELECKRRAILEQEKFFIDLIREICGASFTSRLDGMCKDFASAITTSNSNTNTNSDDINYSQHNNNDNDTSKKIDSKLYLLTSNYWPSFFQPAKSNSVSDTAQSTCIEVNSDTNNYESTNTHSANTNSVVEKSSLYPLGSGNNINVTNESKSDKLEVQTDLTETNSALLLSSKPKVNNSMLHLPTEEWQSLLSAKENEFYSTHDKRRIQWQHELSTATFTGQFKHNTCAGNNLRSVTNLMVEYTFHGSVLQCAILLTIDEHTRNNENKFNGITFATLCKLLGVPEGAQNIRAAVMSLFFEPYQLIIIEEVETQISRSEEEKEINENNTSELSNTRTDNKTHAKHTLVYSHNNLRTPNNFYEKNEEEYAKLLATSRLTINEHFYSPTHDVYLPMSSTTYKLFHSSILQTAEESHENTTHTSASSPSLTLPREDGGTESVAKGIANQNHNNAHDSHKSKIDTEALLHKQVVESWIVTFMKRNNTSQHHILLDFVKSKVKFVVSSTLFKSAIDWCLERGYLERVHTSTSTLDKSTNETNIDNDTYKYLSESKKYSNYKK